MRIFRSPPFEDRRDAGQKLAAKLSRFRGGRPELEIGGRTVILVDDGLATGVTAHAAVEALKLRKPARLILAAPVCAAQTAELFASKVDELLCLASPCDMGAIGLWYKSIDQTTDAEVVQLLEKARNEQG